MLGKVKEDAGREGRTECLELGWQEQEMVEGEVAVLKKSRIRLWGFVCDFVASTCGTKAMSAVCGRIGLLLLLLPPLPLVLRLTLEVSPEV